MDEDDAEHTLMDAGAIRDSMEVCIDMLFGNDGKDMAGTGESIMVDILKNFV